MTVPSPDSERLPAEPSTGFEAQPSPASFAGISRGADFLRRSWLRILAISLLLPVPCYWHSHLIAGDLASHTYNAWLAQLIARGQAPGLWLAQQTNNILFDQVLTALGNLLGLRMAEKIVVAACVLLFFWSAFALVSALSGRPPWFLTPALAMFAYGWVFQQGFMNYYLSIALAMAGLALLAGARGIPRWTGILLLPLMWMAHPLGAALYLAAGACLYLAPRLEPRKRFGMWVAAAILPVILNIYLGVLFPVEHAGLLKFRWQFNGCDQLSLYGARYHWLARLFLGFAAAGLLLDLATHRTRRPEAAGAESLWSRYRLPVLLYALSFWSVFVLPNGILLPQYNNPITLLTSRATTVCAVLLCALLGVLRPRWWHLAACSALAGAFFLFLYQDTATIDRMETQVDRYVRLLSPGQRVLATIWPLRGSRLLIQHMLDRSCIEHCFSYANYEPSSGQFRVRANPGNGMVLADTRLVADVELGHYVVQPADLPLYEIYQCDARLTELCMRELSAGMVTGSDGPHPYGR